jgi:transcriptional regulator with XRE-family HTH domain
MNLREQRTKLGLTQTQVAIAVGVSLMSYQLWERGAMQPNEENMKKLKEVLQIKS